MTLQQLIYAVKIADTKSMNKAATELFVSQPALSSTMRDLEEELQIEIFIRTNKGIVITTEGEEFLSYARQMVELNQMIEDRYINNMKRKNKFSVSMQHYSFAVEAFMKLAREFALEDFELAVHETKTSEVIENVHNYRSELGILYLNDFNRKYLQRMTWSLQSCFSVMCTYISAIIIRWRAEIRLLLKSWEIIHACLLNREIRIPFILQKKCSVRCSTSR